MSERYSAPKLVAAATALILGGAGIAGCSSKEKPEPVPSAPAKVNCQVQSPNQWQRTPANINAAAIAQHLGVSEAQVRAGGYGGATCDRAITPQEVDNGGPLLNVRGMGNTCLAIGLQVQQIEPSQNVIAVCAAPAPTA